MAAREVDLPEPVAPTNRTRPRLRMMSSVRISGRPRSYHCGISMTMKRATMLTSLRCRKMLTRKRPTLGTDTAKFISRSRANSSRWVSSINSLAISATSPGDRTSEEMVFSSPSNLAQGGAPVAKYRSEPLRSASTFNHSCIRMTITPPCVQIPDFRSLRKPCFPPVRCAPCAVHSAPI